MIMAYALNNENLFRIKLKHQTEIHIHLENRQEH